MHAGVWARVVIAFGALCMIAARGSLPDLLSEVGNTLCPLHTLVQTIWYERQGAFLENARPSHCRSCTRLCVFRGIKLAEQIYVAVTCISKIYTYSGAALPQSMLMSLHMCIVSGKQDVEGDLSVLICDIICLCMVIDVTRGSIWLQGQGR